jgi:hypothetical protein
MELVQGLGRVPRLTSLSDTPQTIVFFADTIEEEVARKVEVKLRCLKEVVQQKEQWTDVLVKESVVKLPQVEETDEDDGSPDGMFLEDQDNEN